MQTAIDTIADFLGTRPISKSSWLSCPQRHLLSDMSESFGASDVTYAGIMIFGIAIKSFLKKTYSWIYNLLMTVLLFDQVFTDDDFDMLITCLPS